jgi:hypothetical protein
MPEITRFYGIIIKLFFGDHPPPHFHAVYGEDNALFNIESLEVIEGICHQEQRSSSSSGRFYTNQN